MNLLFAFLIRFLQAGLAAALYVVCGLLIAGALRVFITRGRLQAWLGGDAISGPLRGWALGLLLPVCSLGAIPMARELLRCGISRRTVFTFLLAVIVSLIVGVLAGLVPASQAARAQIVSSLRSP
jgi:uncharacterized membrane protein YraQ (UPF0718 family)